MGLRHIVEVHPVDACDRGGHPRDRRPRGYLPHSFVLANSDLILPDGDLTLPSGNPRQVGGQHVGDQPVVAINRISCSERMVVHITKVRRSGGDAWLLAVDPALQH